MSHVPILVQVVIAVFLAFGSATVHFFMYVFWPPYWSQSSLQKFLTSAFARTLLKVIKAYKLQLVFGSVSLLESSEIKATTTVDKCQWIHQVQDRTRGDPVIYYIHGGGFSLGLAAPQVSWLKRLAKDLATLRVSILALDYSLAPQHQYPTQIDEAVRGFELLSQSCDKIITLGDSAGGLLAAALALHLKTARIYGQVFISPWAELIPPRTGSAVRNRKLDWVNESFAADCVSAYTGYTVDKLDGKIITDYGDECMDLLYATSESLKSALAPRRACVWGSNELLADTCERFSVKAGIKETCVIEKGVHDIMYFPAKEHQGFGFVRQTIESWLVPLDTVALAKSRGLGAAHHLEQETSGSLVCE